MLFSDICEYTSHILELIIQGNVFQGLKIAYIFYNVICSVNISQSDFLILSFFVIISDVPPLEDMSELLQQVQALKEYKNKTSDNDNTYTASTSNLEKQPLPKRSDIVTKNTQPVSMNLFSI